MKRTWQRKKRKRARKHGFLARTRNNFAVLSARRKKERWQLTPVNSRKWCS